MGNCILSKNKKTPNSTLNSPFSGESNKKKSPEDEMKQMTNEIWIMISLSDSNNVIKIDEFFADTPKKQVMFSMELGTGSLTQLIKHMQGKIHYPLLLQLIMDCLAGLEYASERSIAHMDIKPENILYFEGIKRQAFKDLQTDIVQNDNIILNYHNIVIY